VFVSALIAALGFSGGGAPPFWCGRARAHAARTANIHAPDEQLD